MKFSSFKYNFSKNIGDNIQTIAAEQFLPQIDKRFDRDNLRSISETELYLMIMNGWFSHFPENCFPPSNSILPIFIGFHISYGNRTEKHFLSPKCINYLKSHEPIGCRDKRTMRLLTAKGVKAFYSKCLTLTLPKRTVEPKNPRVFLVDAAHIPIPKKIRQNAVLMSHDIQDVWGDEIKFLMAKRLLKIYRKTAGLIITTKLHCALPCIAMGIPVIFFGNPSEERILLLNDINVKINELPNNWVKRSYTILKKIRLENIFWKLIAPKFYNINWNPQAICVEKEKTELIKVTQDLLKIKTKQYQLNI